MTTIGRIGTAVLFVLLAAVLTPVPATAQDYPTCRSAASDPDGDGWGWEDNRSCRVATGGAAACPSGSSSCGSYTVPGLGARKQAILNAGGDALDVAVAMLETDTMTTNYAYGDNKRDDAANFGVFKQNWYMLRQACSRFRGQSTAQWNNGAALNSSLSADVACLNQSQAFYGITTWFAGHRNGQTGISNPNTSDIARYRNAIYWMRDQLNSNSANLRNDTRFWVSVPPI